jgi:hypothetical protein
LHHRLQEGAHLHLAHLLLDLLHPPHLDQGLAARLFGGEAAGHVLVLEDRGIGADLVVEIALLLSAASEVAPEAA